MPVKPKDIPCKYPDCGRPIGIRPVDPGLCNSHYAQWKRGEELRPINKQRTGAQKAIDIAERRQTCTGCGERKAFDSYGRFIKRGRVVRVRRCKQCLSRPEQKAANRDRKYSLKPGEWVRMFEEQGRACKICRASDPGHANGWQTDHDHSCCPGPRSCGQCVRGILCLWCNINLSWYERHATFIDSYVTVPQCMPDEAAT